MTSFSSSLKGFIKTFQDLGAKNLEPIEVAVLLKHPFIQDLISNYSDYKFPVSITPKCSNVVGLRFRTCYDVSKCELAWKRKKLDSARPGQARIWRS